MTCWILSLSLFIYSKNKFSFRDPEVSFKNRFRNSTSNLRMLLVASESSCFFLSWLRFFESKSCTFSIYHSYWMIIVSQVWPETYFEHISSRTNLMKRSSFYLITLMKSSSEFWRVFSTILRPLKLSNFASSPTFGTRRSFEISTSFSFTSISWSSASSSSKLVSMNYLALAISAALTISALEQPGLP